MPVTIVPWRYIYSRGGATPVPCVAHYQHTDALFGEGSHRITEHRQNGVALLKFPPLSLRHDDDAAFLARHHARRCLQADFRVLRDEGDMAVGV